MQEVLPKSELKKKQVALFLTPSAIDRLDNVAKILGENSNGKLTKNGLLEMAVNHMLDEAEKAIDTVEKEEDPESFNTVIICAHNGGQDFIKEHNYWEYAKLDTNKLKYLRYICLFIGAPISNISYYAEIDKFEEKIIDNRKKYRIYIKNGLKKLPHPVPRGDLNAMHVRSPRYTTLDKIKNAKEYSDLL